MAYARTVAIVMKISGQEMDRGRLCPLQQEISEGNWASDEFNL
jgi:hypothetical protein